jgi:hypothetical protein
VEDEAVIVKVENDEDEDEKTEAAAAEVETKTEEKVEGEETKPSTPTPVEPSVSDEDKKPAQEVKGDNRRWDICRGILVSGLLNLVLTCAALADLISSTCTDGAARRGDRDFPPCRPRGLG